MPNGDSKFAVDWKFNQLYGHCNYPAVQTSSFWEQLEKTKISGTRLRGSEQAEFNYAPLKASRLTNMDKNIECSQVHNEVRHNKTNN